MNKEQFINIVVRNVKHFGSEQGLDTASTLISTIQDTFKKEQHDAIQPILIALGYIQNRETDIFEILHKESRQMVIDIIVSISPDIKIPQKVLESLSD